MKNLEYAKKGFLLIFVVGFLFSIGLNIGNTLFPMYAAIEFNASSSTIGLLMSVSSMVSLLILLPFGLLSDKLGRKPLITLSLMASTISFLMLFLASSIEMLLVAQLVFGLSFPLFFPSMSALVADIVPPHFSEKAVGLYLLSQSTGMFLGPFIASLLLKVSTIRNNYLYSLFIFIFAFILALGIKTSRPTTQRSSRVLGSFWKTIKNKSIIATSFASGSFFFLNSTVMTFYPIFAINQYHADPATVALVFSIRSFVLMLVRLLTVTWLISRLSEKRLISTALIISTSLALLYITRDFWQSGILITLTGVTHGIIVPMVAMKITTLTSSQERGTANSIYMLFNNLNGTLSPLLMGFASEAWGMVMIFPLITIMPVIGLVSSKYIQ